MINIAFSTVQFCLGYGISNDWRSKVRYNSKKIKKIYAVLVSDFSTFVNIQKANNYYKSY